MKQFRFLVIERHRVPINVPKTEFVREYGRTNIKTVRDKGGAVVNHDIEVAGDIKSVRPETVEAKNYSQAKKILRAKHGLLPFFSYRQIPLEAHQIVANGKTLEVADVSEES